MPVHSTDGGGKSVNNPRFEEAEQTGIHRDEDPGDPLPTTRQQSAELWLDSPPSDRRRFLASPPKLPATLVVAEALLVAWAPTAFTRGVAEIRITCDSSMHHQRSQMSHTICASKVICGHLYRAGTPPRHCPQFRTMWSTTRVPTSATFSTVSAKPPAVSPGAGSRCCSVVSLGFPWSKLTAPRRLNRRSVP